MILGIGDDNDRQRYPRFLRSSLEKIITQINRMENLFESVPSKLSSYLFVCVQQLFLKGV